MMTDQTAYHLLRNIKSRNDKAYTLLATCYKGNQSNGTTLICDMENSDIICVASRGRMIDGKNRQCLEPCPVEGKTNCLTTVEKDNLLIQRPHGYNAGKIYTDKAPTLTANAWQENNLIMSNNTKQLNPSGESNNGQQPYQQNRVYDINHKAPACCASLTGGAYAIADENAPEVRIRRLTPTECARLQTVPDWYKWGCSNTQQYKMLGNGWTIEVIAHILSFLQLKAKRKEDTEEPKPRNCGNCALCIHTYMGSECQLTDNPVDDAQDGCIDYIPED